MGCSASANQTGCAANVLTPKRPSSTLGKLKYGRSSSSVILNFDSLHARKSNAACQKHIAHIVHNMTEERVNTSSPLDRRLHCCDSSEDLSESWGHMFVVCPSIVRMSTNFVLASVYSGAFRA